MSIWAGLIVARVMFLADSPVATGAEADRLLAAAPGPRVELAEVLGQALLSQGIAVPREDVRLGKWLSARPTEVPVNLKTRGLVVALADGRLGLTAGRGAVIESRGAGLSVVQAPEPGRYVAAYVTPGITVLGGGL